MDYAVLSLLAGAYFIPFVWSLYLAIKYGQDYLAIFCFVPILNIGMIICFYDLQKEVKEHNEKMLKARKQIAAWEDFYFLRIKFLDGTEIITEKETPYWSSFDERVISPRELCENKIANIIHKQKYDKGDAIFPYHTISEIIIERWEAK